MPLFTLIKEEKKDIIAVAMVVCVGYGTTVVVCGSS